MILFAFQDSLFRSGPTIIHAVRFDRWDYELGHHGDPEHYFLVWTSFCGKRARVYRRNDGILIDALPFWELPDEVPRRRCLACIRAERIYREEWEAIDDGGA